VREITAAIPVPKAQETTAQVEKRKKISKRVKRNRFIALGLAVALGIFGWYALIGPGSRVVVPSTVGATQDEVRAALDPLGLTFVIAEKRFSEEIAAERVIESSPEGGGRIDQGGIVDLVISKGPERYAIPQLAGLTPKAAANLVKKLPLSLQPNIEEFNPTVPKGYVIGSVPNSGEKVKRGTAITIRISKGIEQIAVASYVGKSADQALNELTEAGFMVSSIYGFSEIRLAGEVISQKPEGGKNVNKGAEIELVVSKGSQFAYIPNVFSIEEAQAVQSLKDLELKVVVKKIGKKAVKKVTSVSPKVGTKVKRGSTVTITVG
jgi:serine/threonine-protein kinase